MKSKIDQKTEEVKPSEKVLILRTCDNDLKSYGGFQWPASGYVEAPDFKPTEQCGNGLHGLVDGVGDWGLLDWSADAKAMICEVDGATVIQLGGKVKFKSAIVKEVCSLAYAIGKLFCSKKRIEKQVFDIQEEAKKGDGKNVAEGYYSTAASSGDSSKAASSGDSSKAASSGDSSKAASSGDYSTAASSGNSSTAASSGDSSKAASSGDSSTAASSGNSSTAASSGNSSTAASSGDSSTAASSGNSSTAASSGDSSKAASSGNDTISMVAGVGGMAKAGKNGCFALAYNDGKRNRILVGYVGEDDIKDDVWYYIKDGKLTEYK